MSTYNKRKYPINLFTLRIKDGNQERRYQRTIAKKSLGRYRFAIISGIFFYLIFAFVDGSTYPTVWEEFNLVRLAYVVPLLLVALVLSFTKVYLKFAGAINLLAVIIAGLGIVFMAYLGKDEPEISRIYPSLILVFFYLYAFLNVPFYLGLLFGSGLIGAYLMVAWHIQVMPLQVFNNMLYMLCASNIVGVSVAYIIEHHSKSEYLLREQLSEVMLKDALTGLKNRHYYEQFCVPEIGKFVEKSEQLWNLERRIGDIKTAKYGMLMIDIDFFKTINDTFGHHSGDLVLQQFAKLLTDNVRQSDDVLRIGGEEFLVIVKLTTDQILYEFVKKIGKLIEGHDFHIEGNKVVGCTASMGLVIIPEIEALNVEELLIFADRGLYKAKGNGRNKGCRAFSKNKKMHYETINW